MLGRYCTLCLFEPVSWKCCSSILGGLMGEWRTLTCRLCAAREQQQYNKEAKAPPELVLTLCGFTTTGKTFLHGPWQTCNYSCEVWTKFHSFQWTHQCRNRERFVSLLEVNIRELWHSNLQNLIATHLHCADLWGNSENPESPRLAVSHHPLVHNLLCQGWAGPHKLVIWETGVDGKYIPLDLLISLLFCLAAS